ncbi:MAG: hypothetical protein IJ929_02040 [Prevotella sp.]|nr:hypothetical protein [Prevotella sp.]
MTEDVNISQLFRDLMTHLEGTEPAAEDLRVALNSIIGKYKLHPSVVLSLLARLTAGYIHMTQKMYNQSNADVVVEEDFHSMLEAQLTDLDMSDLGIEIEKMKNEDVN